MVTVIKLGANVSLSTREYFKWINGRSLRFDGGIHIGNPNSFYLDFFLLTERGFIKKKLRKDFFPAFSNINKGKTNRKTVLMLLMNTRINPNPEFITP
ncbi:MAG TPA: hypothetical protein VNM45_05930 [Bacillus sp. (in: firmicutes)]|nr:hypothetical protein [Bacillus sp. (in: firmicutes)]